MTMQAKMLVKDLLCSADVRVDGKRPWDIRVHDERFYGRVLAQGSLGLGESYMDGWWECDAADVLIDKILRARLDKRVKTSARALWNVAGRGF